MIDQVIVFGTLIGALTLFVYGRWRYDLVALMSLLVVVSAGIVSGEEAFQGFGHPAVVTVAAVLVISRGLGKAGIVDMIARWLEHLGSSLTAQLAALIGLVVVTSAFMNNVGALALLMPVVIRIAGSRNLSPSIYLMPLAFGSLLGGLITLIGTPPNIIIAAFRQSAGMAPFSMFDFAPVGLGIALVGGLFIILVGWRLVPHRRVSSSGDEFFQIKSYLTEIRIQEESDIVGKRLNELAVFAENDVVILGVARDGRPFGMPTPWEILHGGDILVVESDSEDLEALMEAGGIELAGSRDVCLESEHGKDTEARAADDEDGNGCARILRSGNMDFMEVVVKLESPILGKTVKQVGLRRRYGINLVAVSREGKKIAPRLRQIRFRAGDVLLLQGSRRVASEVLSNLGCLPLARRELRLGEAKGAVLGTTFFALALIVATLRWLPIHVSLVFAAVAMVLTGIVSVSELYESVDWPVIVLLGAMIPVGFALEKTGGAGLIADKILLTAGRVSPEMTLGILMVATMMLSNVVNNAATAVLMAPIAISLAQGLNASVDPFLMAVAAGSSSPFMTPIGHQSNTLVMGPGEYRFGDYWRMGLPLSILILIVAVPLVLRVWPL